MAQGGARVEGAGVKGEDVAVGGGASECGGASPQKFEAELDLARCGGCAGNHACRWRNARGSEDQGIGLIEIRPVKKIEYLRPKLKI